MFAVFLDVVKGFVGIREDARAGILTLGKGNANAERDGRQTVGRLGKLFVDRCDLIHNGIFQAGIHLDHDDGELVAADAAYIVDASERRDFLEFGKLLKHTKPPRLPITETGAVIKVTA